MKVWIEACRLRTLPLSAAGVLIAAGLAGFWGCFRLEVFLPMLLMVLLLQIVANFADEYGDLDRADTEERIGPKRGMQRGEITRASMKRALIIGSAAAGGAALVLLLIAFGGGHWGWFALFVALGAFCIAGAITYTVGTHAYGYHALGDLASFLFFGIIAVLGGFFLYSLRFVDVAVLPAVGLGCLVVGVLNLNNMRDRTTDAATGKRTIAVILGARGALAYHCLLIAVGAGCFLAFGLCLHLTSPLRWAYVLFLVPLVAQLVGALKVEDPADYDRFMKPLSLSTALLALAFALCIGL